ncbi:hypothetical protein CsatB_026878 [Cannabis sativa]
MDQIKLACEHLQVQPSSDDCGLCLPWSPCASLSTHNVATEAFHVCPHLNHLGYQLSTSVVTNKNLTVPALLPHSCQQASFLTKAPPAAYNVSQANLA